MSKSVPAVHLKIFPCITFGIFKGRWRATKLTVLAITRIYGALPEINGCIIVYGHVQVMK